MQENAGAEVGDSIMSEEEMDTWSVSGMYFSLPPFRIQKGIPLVEVLEAVKGKLPPRLRPNTVGRATRVQVPKCAGKTGETYTVWQFKGPKGGIVTEFHLYKALLDKRGRIFRWEIV